MEVRNYVKLRFRFGLVESEALGHDLLFILGLTLGVWVFVLGLEWIHCGGEAVTQ